MFVIGLFLLMSALSVAVWQGFLQKRKIEGVDWRREYIPRFLLGIFGVGVLLVPLLLLVSSDDTSLWYKINTSREYGIKVLLVSLVLFAGYTLLQIWGERVMVKKREALYAFWEKKEIPEKITGIWKKAGFVLLVLLTGIMFYLNARLMFDNVLWGDEAFSANTAAKSVGGILQVMYYWDNHPPLYYYWLKLFGELFGYTVPVFHGASLTAFAIGLLLAVILFRKHFGIIPTCFYIVISGVGAACLEYNLEVRMYALAFLAVTGCFYCAYRIFAGAGKRAWIGMVLWALAGAYSHYYALVTVGIMLFFTGVFVWIREKGDSWKKGVAAIAAFLVGYAPWLYFFFTALKNVSGNWWMTDILPLQESLEMVMGGEGMCRVIQPTLILVLLICLVADSRVLQISGKKMHFTKPSMKNWTAKTYAMTVSGLTLVATLCFAYLLCVVMGPMLAKRYLYPLSAVGILLLVICTGRLLELAGEQERKSGLAGLQFLAGVALAAELGVLLVIGAGNERAYREITMEQEEATSQTLSLIGTPGKEVQLVTNGVKHLGWTVLYFYYPEQEIINGDYHGATADSYWYFSPSELGESEEQELLESGFSVTDYKEQQISQYPFYLYYVTK